MKVGETLRPHCTRLSIYVYIFCLFQTDYDNEHVREKTPDRQDAHVNNIPQVLVDAPAVCVAVPRRPAVIEWEQYHRDDPYVPDWLGDRPRRTGILVDTSEFSYLDYFKLFFPTDLFDLITTQTNLYATQFMESHDNLPRHSRFRQWTPTSPAEMQAYVAIQIMIGLNNRPEIEDYWGTFWLTKNRVAEIMPRNKFELLTSFIHFNDNTNRVPRGQEGYDALFKVRPMLDMVDPVYSAVYKPDKELALDESMIKYKGRLFFRQYMPAKPTKWGIKTFALCESNSGYALKLLIYTGKGTFVVAPDSSLTITEQVVVKLTEGFHHQGHVLYTDNYYTSPNLYTELRHNGIGACGTVRANRKNMPRDILAGQLHLVKGDLPVFRKSSNDDLVTSVMMDTKRVQFLSTVHNDLTTDKSIRAKGTADGHRTIEKPVMGADYNIHMNGVDIFDQKLGTYGYPHKSSKWYMPVFHRVREVALVNGYILYKKATLNKNEKPVSPRVFREMVIDGLLENWDMTGFVRAHQQPGDGKPGRLTERHFSGQYTDKKHRPDCIVCSDRRTPGWRRVQTVYYCVQCQFPMCSTTCFRIYHTCIDFKLAAGRQIYKL